MSTLLVTEILEDWRELKRTSIRTGVPLENGTGLKNLRNFRMLGTKLFPLPITTRTEDVAIRVFYFRREESPDGDVDLENGWMREFPDLFLAEVGLRLASDLEDTGAQRYFTSMRDEARRAYDDKLQEEEFAAQVLSF